MAQLAKGIKTPASAEAFRQAGSFCKDRATPAKMDSGQAAVLEAERLRLIPEAQAGQVCRAAAQVDPAAVQP
jgi:hypothetical protein